MAETTEVAPELDPAWVEDFAQRWLEAWNSHEPERLLALMTEDIVYDDSAWPTTMRGHAEVRMFLDHAWTGFPDMRFEEVEGPFIVPGKPKAAFQWKGTATQTGPIDPPGFAPTGRRIEFFGADFHEYRDGRVCRLTIVFDMAGVAMQLGLMPKPGSRMEKIGATAQRLGAKAQAMIQERRKK
jgi:steroid delta-isomerase-like uncharacterized protein